MTKVELERSMRQHVKAEFISRNELTQYLGYKRNSSVDNVLRGLDKFQSKYFIPEVAARMVQLIDR